MQTTPTYGKPVQVTLNEGECVFMFDGKINVCTVHDWKVEMDTNMQQVHSIGSKVPITLGGIPRTKITINAYEKNMEQLGSTIGGVRVEEEPEEEKPKDKDLVEPDYEDLI